MGEAMKTRVIQRRLAMVALLGGLMVSLTFPAGATNFAVLLGGSSGEVYLDGCDSVEISDLTVDVLTEPSPPRSDHVRKRPGKVKYSNLTLRMSGESGGTKELQDWFENRPTERKSGSIVYLDREGNEVLRCPDCVPPWLDEATATYTFLECYPLGHHVEEEVFGDGSVRTMNVFEIGTNGLHLSVNPAARVELKPRIRVASVPAAGKELKPRIPVGTVPPAGMALVNTSFTSWSGGEPVIIQDGLFGGTFFHEPSLGKKGVQNVSFSSSAPSSKFVCDMVNGMASGKPSSSTLSVQEIIGNRPSRTAYTYHECWPCRYVFPHFPHPAVRTPTSWRSLSLPLRKWSAVNKYAKEACHEPIDVLYRLCCVDAAGRARFPCPRRALV